MKIKLNELQADIEYVLPYLPRESLDHWSEHDKARVAIDNALPALLEIAQAALAYAIELNKPGSAMRNYPATVEAHRVLLTVVAKVSP